MKADPHLLGGRACAAEPAEMMSGDARLFVSIVRAVFRRVVSDASLRRAAGQASQKSGQRTWRVSK
jgi:hypothetical protein